MIEIDSITKRFGKSVVFEDLSLNVEDGTVIVVIGPSGAGKSTLLRCINGLERFEVGEIRFDGKPVGKSKRDIRELRKHVGMVFQSFNLFPHMTALKNVTLAPVLVQGTSRRLAEAEAAELLAKVGLAHKRDSLPSELSGGEQQRVAIARALAMNPKVMLFDEPTSSLDPERVVEVQDVIADLAGEGMTMWIATHAMAFARSIAHEVVVIADGGIVEKGPPDEVFVRPSQPRTQALLRTILAGR